MKKRIMIIGAGQSGKSTLANWLNRTDRPLCKTQDAIYGNRTIDIPGAYLENTWMYKYIIALSQGASHVLILVDQSRPVEVYSPGFACIFTCPVTGVITKCDEHPENYNLCIRQLRRCGVQEVILPISLRTGAGLAALEERLAATHAG